jgi:hypothetical protein
MLAELLVSIKANDEQAPAMVRALKAGAVLLAAGLVAAVVAALRGHH